jgi:hypothetical protein
MATLGVALSLTLFSLGGANSTCKFCLRTLIFGRPMTIFGPVLDMIVVSSAVIAGTMCEESRSDINIDLLCLVRVHCFASSLVTLRGYKSSSHHCVALHLLRQSIVPSSPPSLRLKRKRKRKKEEKKKGEILVFRERYFSFPL